MVPAEGVDMCGSVRAAAGMHVVFAAAQSPAFCLHPSQHRGRVPGVDAYVCLPGWVPAVQHLLPLQVGWLQGRTQT